MASPLQLRIRIDYDSSPIKQASSDVKKFGDEVAKATIAVSGSSGDVRKFVTEVKKIGQVPDVIKPHISNFQQLRHELSNVITTLRSFHKLFFVGALLAGPFIAATKAAVDFDKTLQPIQTKLNQIGFTGIAEGQRLAQFAKDFSKATGATAQEALQSIDLLITKTKTSADAERIISVAQSIHHATGRKLVDVTQAIAEAQTGNAASLALLTNTTEQHINALVKEGTLVQNLSGLFKEAGERGAASLSGRLEELISKFKNLGAEAYRLTPLGTAIATAFKVDNAIRGFEDLRKAVLDAGKPLKSIDTRTVDGLSIGAGEAKARIQDLTQALLTLNLTAARRNAIRQQVRDLKVVADTLSSQEASERRLDSVQRKSLITQTALNELEQKREELLSRPRRTNETSQQAAAERRAIDDRISAKQSELIDIKAIEEARTILITKHRELEEEEIASIAAKGIAEQNRNLKESAQKRIQEENKNADNLLRLKRANLELERFNAEKGFGTFKGTDVQQQQRERENLAQQDLNLIILNAKKERDALRANGQFNAEEELRIVAETELKINQLKESYSQDQEKARLDSLSTITDEQLTGIQKIEAATLRSYAIMTANGLDEHKKLEDMTDTEVLKKYQAIDKENSLRSDGLQNFKSESEKILATPQYELLTDAQISKTKEKITSLITDEQKTILEIVKQAQEKIAGYVIPVKAEFDTADFSRKAKELGERAGKEASEAANQAFNNERVKAGPPAAE